MLRKVFVFGMVIVWTASTAWAQSKVEASFGVGYTTSEGIKASEPRLIGGQLYDDLDPTSGGSFNFTFGVFATPNVEIEFLYSRQFSTLQADGIGGPLKLADLALNNYHVNFVYNLGEGDANVRPFFFGGLGATQYSPGDLAAIPRETATDSIDGVTKFSTTWGGGVKFYPAPKVGVKVMGRWTPTYIKSDAEGLWCDPFYGVCWVVGDADYANQFEFSGGLTFRFEE
jgi:hypothetical protein